MTTTDLPAKPDFDAPCDATFDTIFNQPSVFEGRLDDSFAAIDWQAPWLCHLSQLSDISKAINQLSSVNTDPAKTDNIANTPDIIAKVLNAALQKQADDLQQPLPQTKPALNNKA